MAARPESAAPVPPAALPPRGARIVPFYAGDIGREATALVRAGRTVIPMHFGQPSAGASPAALAAAQQALRGREVGYYESEQLRERLVRHYAETYGITIARERVLLTAGASAGLVALFSSLFAPGDRVGVQRPGYPAYRNTLKALHLEPVEIDCGPATRFHLRASDIAAIPGPLHGLIVASPANPTGAVLGRTELDEIAAACRARQTRLISDEIYHGIAYGTRTPCALEVDPEAIIVNSFSKFFRMPGWRLGWVIVPADFASQLAAYLINFFLTPASLSQFAALAAFDDLSELGSSVDAYARNRQLLVEELPKLGLGGVIAPEGAFYLYLDVRHLTNDSLAFCHRLLQDTGIAWAPGIDFDPVHGHEFVRLSFAVSTAEVEQALVLLRPWLAKQAR